MGLKRKPPPGNVRRVRSNGTTTTGAIVTKAGRTSQTESFGEFQVLRLLLDRDPTVRDHRSQPETIHFTDAKGKRHHYTPDILVWRIDGTTELHEVTITSRRSQEAQQQRERAAQALCAGRGWRYVVHTEATLPTPAERANLLLLAVFRPTAVAHPAVLAAYRGALPTGILMGFEDLVTHLMTITGATTGEITRTLCHLLWHGHLVANLRHLLFIDGQPVPDLVVWREEAPQ